VPSSILLKASGLQIEPNQLSAPEGALSEASNVIIKRDNTIEPRRGYKLYGEPFPSSSYRANQLMTYKGRILRHYDNLYIQWDTLVEDALGDSIFDQFSGTFSEPETGRRIRYIEANGNLYFTTSNGIMKISALSATEFSTVTGYIRQAGAVAATDITAMLDVTLGDESDFFTQDSTVAYRAVWGYNDANGNLILGAPSQSVAVYNPLLSLLLGDFSNLLLQLDRLDQPGSLINNGNYVASFNLPVTASATELNTALDNLVQAIDANIIIGNATGSGAAFQIAAGNINMSGTTAIVTPSSGLAPNTVLSVGDQIQILTAYTMSSSGIIAAGVYTIESVSPTTFSFEVIQSAGTGVVTVTASNTIVTTGSTVSLLATATDGSTNFTFSLATPTGPTLTTTSTNSATLYDASNETVIVVATSVTTGASGTITITFGTGSSITPTGSNTNTAIIQDYNYEAIIPAFTPPNTPSEPTTDQDLVSLQTYLGNIILQLQSELSGVIPITLLDEYIDPIALTTTASVTVTVPIPAGVTLTNGYFLQLYRTQVTSATGTTVLANLSPGDEMALAYEAYPTAAQIAAGFMVIHDITLDGFLGANLYTNANTGVGILYANATPPIAKDIQLFKNVLFYANTQTAQQITINLLGVQQMLNSYNPSNPPTLTIITNGVSNTYTFIEGVAEVIDVVFVNDNGANPGNYAGKYWTLNAGNNGTAYYVWYSTIISGSEVGTDPAPAGYTGIKVVIDSGDTANTIAMKTSNAINTLINQFSSTVSTNTLTVTNLTQGITTAPTNGTAPVTTSVITPGNGQNAALNQVLLANLSSPAQSVDATSRSLVQVINENSNEAVYAYYLSGLQQVPGQISLQARSLSTGVIYLLANNSITGSSFSPDLSPTLTITSISATNPTVITTSSPNGLSDGQQIVISGTNSTPNINGLWTISNVTSNTFTIPAIVTVAGTTGAAISTTAAEYTSNEVHPNRIYYSQVLQPEAVPLLNYIDVGAKDEQILRIFPLRDSLFILKADGLYRLSGQVAPWTVDLFDSATICIAPDSVDIVNNLVFAWCTTGIKMISEAGAQLITRPIDIEILQLASSNYPNFYTATFGVGYESDSSFEMWTVSETTDTIATICYRYSNLTQTWTTWAKTNTCGVINPTDDKMYLGAGDTNYIEQERKSFDRTDYADRQIATVLESHTDYLNGGLTVKLPSVTNMNIGDVLYQQQYVTIYEFNQLLLQLDSDPRLTFDYASLMLSSGADLNAGLIALANALDSDSGTNTKIYYSSIAPQSGTISAASVAFPTVITTSTSNSLITGREVGITGTNTNPNIDGDYQVTVLTGSTFTIPVQVLGPGSPSTVGTYQTIDSSFIDIKTKFNEIVSLLNADSGVGLHSFMMNTTTSDYEAIITGINTVLNTVTLSLALPLVVGDMIVFNAIPSTFTYCPITMGDPLGFKQLTEATFMFQNKVFTSATVGFATDLLPAFTNVTFNGEGPGIFGINNFGNNFFGGGANAAPFRTYIPRNAQRCRYLVIQFSYRTAREFYSLFGVTVTGRVGISTRAYR
jgi:hypothetical protein